MSTVAPNLPTNDWFVMYMMTFSSRLESHGNFHR